MWKSTTLLQENFLDSALSEKKNIVVVISSDMTFSNQRIKVEKKIRNILENISFQ